MTDLDRITARRFEIAEMRKTLDAEDSELDVAERVLRRLAGQPAQPPLRKRRTGRKANPDGIPTNFRNVLDGIRERGAGGAAERSDVLSYVNAHRTEPLSEASFAARISKMSSDGLIVRNGSQLVIVEKEKADVSQ